MSHPGSPENNPEPFKGAPPEEEQKKKKEKKKKDDSSDSESDQEEVKPPKAPPPASYNYEAPPITTSDTGKLDEDACHEAMIQHVNEHCCYGMKPAKEMKIKKFFGSTALHLTLETFAEGRKTKNMHEPYSGGPVDGPQNGPMPAIWDIKVPPNKLFENHKIRKEVPHSSVIKKCWGCGGRGWNTCGRCGGDGQNRCGSCSGRGSVYRSDPDGGRYETCCGSCGGDGRVRCYTCGGDGKVTCRKCRGYKKLRCYVLLICKYMNHDEHYILETTDMPDDLVANVGGTVLFQDTHPFVKPIISYPVPEINNNSAKLVDTHSKNWPDQRTLQQRQTLRGVPVTEVDYEWKDVETRFWVYGNERKVYAPDYPHQCCCGCSVI